MSSTDVPMKTSYTMLNEKIAQIINTYEKKQQMPERSSELVKLYQQKSISSYDVDHLKNDIENVVELIAIVYAATPFQAGEVRVKISNIQQKIIMSQGDAERMMSRAARTSDRISQDLEDLFLTLQVANEDKKKDFISNEFSNIVQNIQNEASNIHDELMAVEKSFDEILVNSLETLDKNHWPLSSEGKKCKTLEKALAEYKITTEHTVKQITFVFKKMKTFLQEVSTDTQKQSELMRRAFDGNRFSGTHLSQEINEFMISMCAVWYATKELASQFVVAFHNGWKMMNNLSGKYLSEEEVEDYLETAANRIEEIAQSRE